MSEVPGILNVIVVRAAAGISLFSVTNLMDYAIRPVFHGFGEEPGDDGRYN
jgi:hypothetical protein